MPLIVLNRSSSSPLTHVSHALHCMIISLVDPGAGNWPTQVAEGRLRFQPMAALRQAHLLRCPLILSSETPLAKKKFMSSPPKMPVLSLPQVGCPAPPLSSAASGARRPASADKGLLAQTRLNSPNGFTVQVVRRYLL